MTSGRRLFLSMPEGNTQKINTEFTSVTIFMYGNKNLI